MKNKLMHNLGLKLLSLGLAVMLWYIISAKGMSEVTLEVPIEYINIPQGHEIVSKEQDKVSVSIFGSEKAVGSIKPEDIRVLVDLNGATAGKAVYKITRKNIKTPSSVTVSSVNPSEVKVVIDRTIKKDVPIRADIKLPSFMQGRINIEVRPAMIQIEGPESLVKNIHFLKTERIDISSLKGDTVKKVHILTDIDKFRSSTDMVEVKITFDRKGKR